MHEIAKLALAPLLIWQGVQVRRRALQLQEAAGARIGHTGEGAVKLRVLIVGDSSGAGVGADAQVDALAGQLAGALAQRLGGRVHWQLIAQTGHASADALAALQTSEMRPADVLVTALGVNDVVSQVKPRRWLQTLERIDRLARERAGVRFTLHSAVPPMHAFPLLPQPLRWILGAQALCMNQALAAALDGHKQRGLQAVPTYLHGNEAAHLMARDGFHPSPAGYRLWAQTLADRLAHEWPRINAMQH